MSIDKDTVRKVARLARLEMSETQIERAVPQIAGIVKWVEELGQVNTDNVEPLASVVNIPLRLRKDVVNDGDCANDVLANAPEEQQGYFVVPKVVE
ncbi:MAG: Asp-tRNA(Asn)/Glu-tRNA(Gln) amidotransferase subunit GatC [Alphaproteobacteria bacterium]